ncbi:MAG: hypothetical protein LKCHEGNO_00293 [Burkholderiaceae bacterium]|nr:hypothetical protein [Burkholderiaceae bacterium]
MSKPIHEMSQWDASVHNSRVPEEEWQATRELTHVATQILTNREEYLAPERREIGRRIGDQQHEMFVVCAPSEALQQQFQQWASDFIAIHDIATDSSPRILAGLAAATQRKVQKLVIRRQGHGMALATLEFAELPGANGQMLRVYSTRVDADSQQRAALARVLLGYSRLGVVMVGDLPQHALDTALQPLREGIARGPWPGRQLLFVPLSAPGALHQLAAQVAGRTGVQVSIAPQAIKPSDAWTSISSTWNRVRGDPSAAMQSLQSTAAAATTARDPIAFPAPAPMRPLAPPPAPLPMQPMPPTRPAAPTTEANNPWQAYVRQCIEITGMISCCVFELTTQRTLAHAGARPGPASLAAQGAALHEAANAAAKAMGLPVAPPDLAVTLAGHHLIVRAIAGRPGLALHAVLDSHAANLMLVKMKLQRLDGDSAASAA